MSDPLEIAGKAVVIIMPSAAFVIAILLLFNGVLYDDAIKAQAGIGVALIYVGLVIDRAKQVERWKR